MSRSFCYNTDKEAVLWKSPLTSPYDEHFEVKIVWTGSTTAAIVFYQESFTDQGDYIKRKVSVPTGFELHEQHPCDDVSTRVQPFDGHFNISYTEKYTLYYKNKCAAMLYPVYKHRIHTFS